MSYVKSCIYLNILKIIKKDLNLLAEQSPKQNCFFCLSEVILGVGDMGEEAKAKVSGHYASSTSKEALLARAGHRHTNGPPDKHSLHMGKAKCNSSLT